MKRSLIIFCGVLFFSVGNLSAQGNNGVLIQPTDSILGGGPRSILELPNVALDGLVLTIDFPTTTLSQVIISDHFTNTVVYSDSFSSSVQVQIDLGEENIGEGSYVLLLYALDRWWRGEFVIEEE